MEIQSHKGVLIFLVCLSIWFQGSSQNACADYRGPFEGRVVDQDTGQPIAGAVVFVEWRSYSITMLLAPHSVSYFYDASELVTDSQGDYYISKKWSFNPWTNWVMDSHVLIFKAGYGPVETGGNLMSIKEQARFLKTLSEAKRKAIGPEVYYNIEFKNDLPIYLLKKLSIEKEICSSSPYPTPDIPIEKKRLIIQEKNKADTYCHSQGHQQ